MKAVFKKYWLLIIIVSLAFILRVYKLGEYPVGITWDEPALGYNAYSILKTGRDEYGKLLPITFKSYGDYKPGLFVYYLVPAIAIFGLNPLAIRLPSALAGVGAVIAIFFLVKTVFSSRKEATILAYLSSLLLAISPWHLQFSRGAWEVNLALLTIILGTIFFLRAIEKEKLRFFILTFLFLAFSFYVYHGAKVFLIVFLGGSLILMGHDLLGLSLSKKKIGIILLALLLLPLFTSFRGSANRAKVMSLFSYPRSEKDTEAILSQENGAKGLYFLLFHSEALNTGRGIAERYFNHLTGKFIFFEGDWASPRHSVPYMGMMYYIELPLLLLGIFYYLGTKKERKENLLIWWLLTGPIPAAITRDQISGVRSYWMVIPLIIFAATGIWWFSNQLKKAGKLWLALGLFSLVLGYLFCFTSYLDLYYLHFPKKNSAGWNYGMERVAQIIAEGKKKYSKVVMTQKYGQPYMFYLFYTKYPPQNYQKQAYLKENPWGDVGTVDNLDNIEFRNVFWPTDRNCKNCLFIDDEFGLPASDALTTPGAKILEEIKFLDGRLAYRVIETR